MKIVRRTLDVVIAIYAVLLIALLVTGGFELEILGIPIKAHGMAALLRVLIPAAMLRFALSTRLSNTVLVLASTLFALVIGEIAVRLWDPPIAQPALKQIHRASADFDWELIPGSSGVGTLGQKIQINSEGMRDREFAGERSDGATRIAVVGDSFTFGVGVELNDTYVKQLEQALVQQFTDVTVTNFGVIGYQLWQYLKVLKIRVQPYRPDLVIIGMFADDIGICLPPYKNKPDWQPANPFEKVFKDKITFSYLLNLIRNAASLLETKYRYHRGYKYLQGMKQRYQSIAENPSSAMHLHMLGKNPDNLYSECLEVFQQIGRWSRDQGIPVLLAIIPDAAQVGKPALQHFNRFVEEAATAANLWFVDVTPVFEQHSDPKVLYLFPLDGHTSVEGHRLIAQTLAKKMAEPALLNPP